MLDRNGLSEMLEERSRDLSDAELDWEARGRLSLWEEGRSERIGRRHVPRKIRRSRLGLYDLAVILLIVASLAAAVACLRHIA